MIFSSFDFLSDLLSFYLGALFCVKKLVLKLVSLPGNFAWQTAGVMCCNLGLKRRSRFPHFSTFEINWLGLFLPRAKVDSAYIKSFCSDTGNTGSEEEFLLSELFLAGELPLLAKPRLEMCGIPLQGLFARRRQLLLTEGPHLYYVDPVNKVLKGEIPWSLELRPEAKNFKTFFVHTVRDR